MSLQSFPGAGNGEGGVGPQGPPGEQGPEGPQGEQGPPGQDGADGATGPAGPAGPTGATGAQGPTGATGAAGSDAPFGRTIELLTSNRNSAEFPDGSSYVPMSHYATADDYIAFDICVGATGTMRVSVQYAMSSAQAANVYFRADRSVRAVGGNPADAIVTGTPFTLTTTADVLERLMSYSQHSSLSFAVTANDRVHFRLNRLGTDVVNDVHTGDFRLINVIPSFV